MARNIMVSNKVYEELKRVKGNDKSFSEVIVEALERSESSKKTIGELIRKHAGALKGDTEYDKLMKWSKKRWKEWQDKSV